MQGDHPLERLFWPDSIAIIGASPDAQRLRGVVLDNAKRVGFAGRLVPVNPNYGEIAGLPCFPDIASAGGPIDVAGIVIPAEGVAKSIEDCAAAGVRFAVIITAGFAEGGETEANRQSELIEVARRTGIRVIGPNCIGYYNDMGNVAVTFSPSGVRGRESAPADYVSERRIGIVAQSGAMGFNLMTRGRNAGLRFSYVVSTGNEADLNTADFLDYMAEDPRTHVIMLFCEAVRDGARFRAALEKARVAGKPVIVVKAGRSEAGRRATSSHTASLSGPDAIYRAIFEHYGVIEAVDLDEAVAIAGTAISSPLPKGRRVGVMTVTGGAGALMADLLAARGLALPVFSPGLQERLAARLPSYGATQNPVDTSGQGHANGPILMDWLATLSQSEEIDLLAMIGSFGRALSTPEEIARVRTTLDQGGKPLSVWTYATQNEAGKQAMTRAGLFAHTNLANCCSALGKLADYAANLREPRGEVRLPADRVDLPADLPSLLSEHRVKTLFRPYGLPSADERIARSEQEAAEAAAAIGFPVALKIQSPDLPHKTEVGGVRLGLGSADAVIAAYREILTSVTRHKPDAVIEGMLVQPMAPKGYEIAIGMMNDPTFGPIMMLGFGGTTIELFGDVVHAPAPLDEKAATRMIRRLKSARLLDGFRGAKPVAIEPLADLVSRLSVIAMLHRDRIREMEFNPVILHADGSGLTIADALVTLI